MLQVAYGGHILNGESYYESDLDYREPGFGSDFFPLEFDISNSDRVFFLLRKRDSIYGDSFSEINYENIIVEAKDVTSGIPIPSVVYIENDVNNDWTESAFDNILFSIDTNINFELKEENPDIFVNRVKAIDIYAKDISDNYFINFRLFIDDDERDFNYIVVPEKRIDERDKISKRIVNPYIDISNLSNFYILISPSSRFREVNKDDYSFSYPYDTIFYKRNKILNDEEFIFEIDNVSNSFVYDSISIFPIVGNHKMGVLKVDSYLKNKMIKEKVNTSFINILVKGKVTEKINTFLINFFI